MRLFARARIAVDEAFAPIAGVDLAVYARVSKGVAAYRYDQSKLPLVAEAYGVSPQRWAVAHQGWLARIRNNSRVSQRFDELLVCR